MAYNTEFTSIKGIIESVYRDSGLDEVNYESAIEDALELIRLIGVPYTYIDKVTDGVNAPMITVADYRAELPTDMAYLVSICKLALDNNYHISAQEEMVETSSLYHYSKVNTAEDLNYMSPSATYPINVIDEYGDLITVEGQIVGQTVKVTPFTTYHYKINNNIIYTDFAEGFIAVYYKAYPLDEEGIIMIPDDEKLKNAVKYHLMYKIDFRKWRAFPEKPGLKALLNDSEQRRDFYVGAARNKAHIPTIDKMEAIKNRHLRSIPHINEHRNGFNSLNSQERRKF